MTNRTTLFLFLGALAITTQQTQAILNEVSGLIEISSATSEESEGSKWGNYLPRVHQFWAPLLTFFNAISMDIGSLPTSIQSLLREDLIKWNKHHKKITRYMREQKDSESFDLIEEKKNHVYTALTAEVLALLGLGVAGSAAVRDQRAIPAVFLLYLLHQASIYYRTNRTIDLKTLIINTALKYHKKRAKNKVNTPSDANYDEFDDEDEGEFDDEY